MQDFNKKAVKIYESETCKDILKRADKKFALKQFKDTDEVYAWILKEIKIEFIEADDSPKLQNAVMTIIKNANDNDQMEDVLNGQGPLLETEDDG